MDGGDTGMAWSKRGGGRPCCQCSNQNSRYAQRFNREVKRGQGGERNEEGNDRRGVKEGVVIGRREREKERKSEKRRQKKDDG